MKLLLSSFISLFLFCSSASAVEYSDQQDSLRMMDRVERLERDLTLLQRQVYNGETPSIQSPATPAATGGNTAESGTGLARLEARIGEIEEQMRTLTGKVEQVEFANTKLAEKLDKQTADNEYRFKALEGGASSTSTAPADNAAPQEEQSAETEPVAAKPRKKNAPAITVADQEQKQESTQTDTASGDDNPSHVLGKLPAKEGSKKAVKKEPKAEEDSPAAEATPAEQYKHAFALVRAAKYDEAEAAFTKFIEENKKDPLTPNAYYWLGEAHYAQNVYDKAAIQFLRAYKSAPTGKKAPESLLKLSMSLGQMKKRKEACATLTKLDDDFPNSPAALKQRAKEESTRLGCK